MRAGSAEAHIRAECAHRSAQSASMRRRRRAAGRSGRRGGGAVWMSGVARRSGRILLGRSRAAAPTVPTTAPAPADDHNDDDRDDNPPSSDASVSHRKAGSVERRIGSVLWTAIGQGGSPLRLRPRSLPAQRAAADDVPGGGASSVPQTSFFAPLALAGKGAEPSPIFPGGAAIEDRHDRGFDDLAADRYART